MSVSMENKGILFVWYYHLPSVSSEEEIEDLVESSINPLLSIHIETGIPFTLAITGCLLERIAKYENTILMLKKLIKKGCVEIAATCFYEIYPPIIPFRYLRMHLLKDINLKKGILDYKPVSFYPPNFTWVSILEPILLDLDIKNVVLDSEHYNYSCKTQVWKWSSEKNKLNTLLKETVVDSKEIHRIYKTSFKNTNNDVSLFFRDFQIIEKLSFGNTGMFHQPYNWEELKEYCADLKLNLRENEFLTIADDGDRINPVSIQNYTLFLNEFESHLFYKLNDLSTPKYAFNEIPYLPSFSIGDHQGFWTSDLDSVHYINLMEQVYQHDQDIHRFGFEDDILDLQDVYFLFWKTISRKKYYLNKLHTLLRKFDK
jgi:hypothetical protein